MKFCTDIDAPLRLNAMYFLKYIFLDYMASLIEQLKIRQESGWEKKKPLYIVRLLYQLS